MKTRGAELFHADRHDEANSRFLQNLQTWLRRKKLSLIIMIERQLSYDMAFPFLRFEIPRNVMTFVVLGS
jgi:hypothetical protein